MSTAEIEVTFACSHSEAPALLAKQAGERAGYVAWPAKSSCTRAGRKVRSSPFPKRSKRNVKQQIRKRSQTSHIPASS